MKLQTKTWAATAMIGGLALLYMPKAEAITWNSFKSWFGGSTTTTTTTRIAPATTPITIDRAAVTARTPVVNTTTRRTIGNVDGYEVVEEIGFGSGKLIFSPTDGAGQAFAYTFNPVSTVFTVTGNSVTGFNKADNTFLKIAPIDSGFSRSTVNSVTGDVIESAAIPAFQGIEGGQFMHD